MNDGSIFALGWLSCFFIIACIVMVGMCIAIYLEASRDDDENFDLF